MDYSTKGPDRAGKRVFDALQQSERSAEAGGTNPAPPNEPARAAVLPGSQLGPRRAKAGDVIFDNAEGHMLMHTSGNRPIAHAATGRAQKVISQGTESFATHHRFLGRAPERLEVFRLSTGSDEVPKAAARIAKGFATERDGPSERASASQTPYSSYRLMRSGIDPNDWTQASAFRAVRAALRSEEAGVALSARKGTTCDAFVATSIQAAVIAQAMHDGTLPPAARQAIEHIKDHKLHMPGVTQAQYQENKADRYELIPPAASEQIRSLMPPALQVDAKTTPVEELVDRMQLAGSGFEKAGYANPHPGGLQVLPQGHPAVSSALENKEV